MSIDELDDFDVPPDLGDLLDSRDAQLEAEFRDLEQEAEVTKLKRKMAAGGWSGDSKGSTRRRSGSDPLSDLKEGLDREDGPEPTDAERYILVLCPKCEA